MFEEEVEVLSVVLATNALSGDLLYQVNLGVIEKPAAGTGTPSQVKGIASNAIIVYIPIQGKSPYIPGARYSLTVQDDGTLTLKPKG